MNILVTGSNGQVGSEVREFANNSTFNTNNSIFHFTDRTQLDITDRQALAQFIVTNSIDTIINCAAYTAVDKAETDTEMADKINHLAVKNLALISKERNIKLVHISTDYVFDGTNHKPYTETDTPSPTSVYGQTKLDGENAIIQINPPNAIIIRTSWVYSSFGANFVKTMLRLGREKKSLGVVYDQVGTPTYAKDLAAAVLQMLNDECLMLNEKEDNSTLKIYHYSNEGAISWYDFAKEIMKMAKLECQINPIESKEYPTPAKRPHYSVLNKAKIKSEYNIVVPYWKDSLHDCITKIMNGKYRY